MSDLEKIEGYMWVPYLDGPRMLLVDVEHQEIWASLYQTDRRSDSYHASSFKDGVWEYKTFVTKADAVDWILSQYRQRELLTHAIVQKNK